MSAHEINHLLHLYGLGLVVVAVGLQAFCLPIPGSTALAAAAVYASSPHGLPVLGVLVAGVLGTMLGTSAAFLLGRWRGERVLMAVGRIGRQRPERIEQLREDFARNAIAVLFISRFVTGLRNIAGIAAGASGMPAPRFLLVSAAAATAWSTLITVEYYFFGHAFLGASTWLQVVLVVVGLAAAAFSIRFLHTQAQQSRRDRERASGTSGVPEED